MALALPAPAKQPMIIRHEETGRTAQIEDGDPVPEGWCAVEESARPDPAACARRVAKEIEEKA